MSKFANTLFNDGFARVANSSGTTEDERFAEHEQKPLCDGFGRLFVIPVGGGGGIPGFEGEVLYYTGGVLITNAMVHNQQCYITGVTGYNSHPTDMLFVQFHDRNTPVAPGAVPDIIIPVPGNKTTFSYGMTVRFDFGFLIAISTTELTYTAPASPYLSTVVKLAVAS